MIDGKKRYETEAFLPIVLDLAKTSGKEDFYIDLEKYMNKINYNDERIIR